MTDPIVLSYYPLMRSYVEDLSRSVGRPVSNVVISSLNIVGGARSLIGWFLALRVETIYIPHPSADFTPFLPILRILARLPKRSAVVRVDPGFQLRTEGWMEAITAGFSLALRIVGSLVTLPGYYLRLRRLVRMKRRDTPASTARQVLYLKANLWSGVSAGGSVSHTVGVVSALTQCDHPVTYVSINQAQELAGIPDTTICPLPLPFGFAYPRELNIYRYERTLDRWGKRQTRRNFAFLYHRLTLGSTAAIGVAHHLGIPLVVEYNGSEVWISSHWGTRLKLPRLAELAEEAMLRHADLIVTVSDSLRDELIARGIEAERILTCPNGVDPERFDPDAFTAEQRADLRTRLGIAPERIVAMFIGTFGPWHGASVAADALIHLHTHGVAPHLHMVFVGDGPGREKVEATLAEHGLAGRCTFTGLVAPADIPLYLAASDIVLAPHVANADSSAFFGSPTKLFEYMAMARPVLASSLGQIAEVMAGAPTVGQIPDTVPPGAPGLLVEPGNALALAAGLAFLAERPDWRRICGANGRDRVLQRYTWTQHTRRIVAGLGRLLPPAAPPRGRTTVLINAVHAKSGGGVTYLRNTLPLWAGRDDLAVHIAIQRGQEAMMREIVPDLPLHVLPAKPRLATVLIQEQIDIPRLARRLGADVVYSPANYGPVWGARTVLLLRNSFDVRSIDARTAKRLYWLGVKLLTWVSFLACRRAITVSHHARATFTAAFHADADLRFDVVYHGVSPSFSPPETDSGRHPHRLLAVSDIYIQKNLETAIEAVALLAPRYPDISLDIAGRTLDLDYFDQLTRHCTRLGVADRVRFLGGVPPSTIAELLRQADVFLFPSLVETFGNPLLEAMASGLPVVCSNTSAMPEVTGDAALYADPGDAGQFARAVSHLFDDRQVWRRQSANGVARARAFNWQKTADQTAEVLIDAGRG